MQKAFTMVELIFVIVIIGVLAAVAIPKLAGTRHDASISVEVRNAKQVLQDFGSTYIAQGSFLTLTDIEANKAVKCFQFSTTSDGNITVKVEADSETACPASVLEGVKSFALELGIIDENSTEKVYSFGTQSIQQ